MSTKSKEEIIEKQEMAMLGPNRVFPEQSLSSAMDEYARQTAIGFAEFIVNKAKARGCYDDKGKLKFWVTGSGTQEEEYSTTGLYDLLYLQSLNK